MNENPFIGAYWDARRENRQQCAHRVHRFLLSLQSDAILSKWYLKARSRREADVALELQAEVIAKRLRTNVRDVGGEAIQELGFSISVWNGLASTPASLAVTCGAFSEYVKNSAVINLPPSAAPQTAGACGPFSALVEKLVVAFDPDIALATSTEYLARAGGGMPWEKGGWVVYTRGKAVLVTV